MNNSHVKPFAPTPVPFSAPGRPLRIPPIPRIQPDPEGIGRIPSEKPPPKINPTISRKSEEATQTAEYPPSLLSSDQFGPEDSTIREDDRPPGRVLFSAKDRFGPTPQIPFDPGDL